MANPPIDLADLAAAVTAQTTACQNFTDQQILLYTTTDPTVVMTDANGNPVTIPSWYATVGANAAAVDAMQAQVTANANAIAAIQTADSTFGTEIAAIQAAQTTNEGNISTLQSQMTTVQSKQSADETNISNLQNAVNALQTGSSSSGSNLTALQNQVNEIQTQQNTDIGSISTLNTNLTSLTTTVNSNQAAITSLQTTLQTVQSNMTTDEGNISTLQGQVTTLQGQVATNATNITSAVGNISTLQSQVSTLQSQLGDDETNLNNTNATVLNLQNTVVSQGSVLSNLSSELTAAQAQEASDVSNLGQEITANGTAITGLQTALNSMPQVGKYDPAYVSARFFTQVFIDDEGHVVGGVSRVTGKLWMLNGGWISERLDEIEGRTTAPAFTYYGSDGNGNFVSLNAPSSGRYIKMIGDIAPDPNSGTNGSMLSTYQMGITPEGVIEIGGQNLAEVIGYLKSRVVPDSKIVQGPTDNLSTFIGDTTLLQYGSGGMNGAAVASDMTCAQLAARVGVYPVLLSFENRQITGGTANTVTAWNSILVGSPGSTQSVFPITAGSPSQSVLGRVGDIQGTLTAASSDSTLTFTPTNLASGSKYVGDNDPFIPADAGNMMAAKMFVIGMGRNDITNGTAVGSILPYFTAVIDAISKMDANFVIVTPYNYASEDNTTDNGKAVIALEQLLQSLYPLNTFNTRQFLQNCYAGQSGANASTYFGNGLVPADYFNPDNKTLTGAASGYLMNGLYAFVAERNLGSLPVFE
jgi:predicted  nucleic acid-binding Zn-ribbon protein